MWVTVLVPITLPGSLISTRGNRAARANNASDEIPNPGAITPPRYSPFAEITSNVIAVPKSTTMHGPPYSANAATPFTIRSAPTSSGLSTSTAIPVFTPGSTNRARLPKYFRAISPNVQFTGGTTDEMITPSIASRSSPPSVKRFRVSTPYSSTVCSRAVVNRQCAINCSPLNTPSTVFVFPTSIVSSIQTAFVAAGLQTRSVDSASAFTPFLLCPAFVRPSEIHLCYIIFATNPNLPHRFHIPRNHRKQAPIRALYPQQTFRRQPHGNPAKRLCPRRYPHF